MTRVPFFRYLFFSIISLITGQANGRVGEAGGVWELPEQGRGRNLVDGDFPDESGKSVGDNKHFILSLCHI